MSIDLSSGPAIVDPGQIAAAQAGSEAALGQILDAFRGYLLAIARRELPVDLRAKAGASDLVQETFVDAHRGFPQFHGQSEVELLAWLRRILLHNLNDFVRQYRDCAKRQIALEVPRGGRTTQVSTAHEPVADCLTPSGCAIQDEQATALHRALQQLPEDYQTVLRLRYWEGRSFEEIGGIMKRSAEAARKVWFRAVQALERELDAGHGCGPR